MVDYSYCKGCGHTIITKTVDKLLQKYNGTLIGTVGCSAPIHKFVGCKAVCAPHGRGIPIGTGIKLVHPDRKVIVYSGDGDALNIGIEHLCHATARNTNMVQIIVNNASFAMTGFQMSSTTPIGVKTKTCISGRNEEVHGVPMDPSFVKLINPKVNFQRCHVTRKNNFKEILEDALNYDGFSVIEVFSPCPTFFGGDIKKSYKFTKEQYDLNTSKHICKCRK